MPAPEGFDYEVGGSEVLISHHGRRATVLRGAAAARFLDDVEREDDQCAGAERDQDLQPIGLDPGEAGGDEALCLAADIARVEDGGFSDAVRIGHLDTRQAATAMVAGVPASRKAIRPHSSRLR